MEKTWYAEHELFSRCWLAPLCDALFVLLFCAKNKIIVIIFRSISTSKLTIMIFPLAALFQSTRMRRSGCARIRSDKRDRRCTSDGQTIKCELLHSNKVNWRDEVKRNTIILTADNCFIVAVALARRRDRRAERLHGDVETSESTVTNHVRSGLAASDHSSPATRSKWRQKITYMFEAIDRCLSQHVAALSLFPALAPLPLFLFSVACISFKCQIRIIAAVEPK